MTHNHEQERNDKELKAIDGCVLVKGKTGRKPSGQPLDLKSWWDKFKSGGEKYRRRRPYVTDQIGKPQRI